MFSDLQQIEIITKVFCINDQELTDSGICQLVTKPSRDRERKIKFETVSDYHYISELNCVLKFSQAYNRYLGLDIII